MARFRDREVSRRYQHRRPRYPIHDPGRWLHAGHGADRWRTNFWRADILTADNAGTTTTNYDKDSFREFYFEFSDFQHAYVAGKGATFANATQRSAARATPCQVPTAIKADPLNAINPAGAIQNPAVSGAQPG